VQAVLDYGAERRVHASEVPSACDSLRAFVNEVRAQSGMQKLSAAAAQILIDDATAIMTLLGC
jgi:hypothetical protein